MALVYERSKAASIEDLVGEQQVAPEPGGCEALALSNGGAREAEMAGAGLTPGERRALVRLDVRAETVSGQGGCHRGEVVLEGGRIDDERRRDEVGEAHAGIVPAPADGEGIRMDLRGGPSGR
jgi:hypothetical protein